MHACRNLRHQLRPIHPASIANDIDTRQPASFNEVVTGSGRLEPTHQAAPIAQLATDANAVVVECFEKLEHARLQCGAHPASATTHARYAGDGFLTDAVLGAICWRSLQSGIEGDRRPVEQLQSL